MTSRAAKASPPARRIATGLVPTMDRARLTAAALVDAAASAEPATARPATTARLNRLYCIFMVNSPW